MGIKRCRQEGAMRGSNAVDFKTPMDNTMLPKHAIAWLQMANEVAPARR
jgi:hypothetical protein